MPQLLLDIHHTVEAAGSGLSSDKAAGWRQRDRARLDQAEGECPPPDEAHRTGQRGRLKRTKARTLLERVRAFEDDVLRFMEVASVPFTNKQSENDLRMTKGQQKISGGFRSMDGARFFGRVRRYLSTCRRQGMTATEARARLFQGKQPLFIEEKEGTGGE